MPHFSKLVEAYGHAGCSKWFINLSPPSKIQGPEMRLPTDLDSKAEKKALGKIVSNERHFRHRDWQLPMNSGVVILSSQQADKEKRRVDKFPDEQPQSIHFSAHDQYSTAPHSIEATEGWFAGATNWPWPIWSVWA
jgi:hypothetical protein